MKFKQIMEMAIKKGIEADPRSKEDIEKILQDRKNVYKRLKDAKKDTFDMASLDNPYNDSRIIWGDPETEVDQAWVGIDIDTPEIMLVKQISALSGSNPVIISHHPLGRSYANFYEVMDMQSDILQGMGVTASIAETLTKRRKAEVARKVAPANHMRPQDAAGILEVPTMNIHTPADNHVKDYLDGLVKKENPRKMRDLIDMLYGIEEYRISASNGTPPAILAGDKDNSCGKVFVDMTGGTEGSAELLKNLVGSGVSTVLAMHMSDKHYEAAKDCNINVVIAGHIASDNIGLNLLLDNIVLELGKIDIIEFSGFRRVSRIG